MFRDWFRSFVSIYLFWACQSFIANLASTMRKMSKQSRQSGYKSNLCILKSLMSPCERCLNGLRCCVDLADPFSRTECSAWMFLPVSQKTGTMKETKWRVKERRRTHKDGLPLLWDHEDDQRWSTVVYTIGRAQGTFDYRKYGESDPRGYERVWSIKSIFCGRAHLGILQVPVQEYVRFPPSLIRLNSQG